MIGHSRIGIKRLTRLGTVSMRHVGRTQGLATGDTGCRTTEGSGDSLEEAVVVRSMRVNKGGLLLRLELGELWGST